MNSENLQRLLQSRVCNTPRGFRVGARVCVSAEFAAARVNPIMQLVFNHLNIIQIIFDDVDQVTQTLLLLLQMLKDN